VHVGLELRDLVGELMSLLLEGRWGCACHPMMLPPQVVVPRAELNHLVSGLGALLRAQVGHLLVHLRESFALLVERAAGYRAVVVTRGGGGQIHPVRPGLHLAHTLTYRTVPIAPVGCFYALQTGDVLAQLFALLLKIPHLGLQVGTYLRISYAGDAPL